MSKLKFQIIPTPSRIIVQRDSHKYDGRIVIPDRAKRKPTTGVVVAVGSDVNIVRVGDKIIFGTFSGTEMGFQNSGSNEVVYYVVLSTDEVLAKLVGEAELVEQGA